MEANDLNQSSEEKMNLNSETTNETPEKDRQQPQDSALSTDPAEIKVSQTLASNASSSEETSPDVSSPASEQEASTPDTAEKSGNEQPLSNEGLSEPTEAEQPDDKVLPAEESSSPKETAGESETEATSSPVPAKATETMESADDTHAEDNTTEAKSPESTSPAISSPEPAQTPETTNSDDTPKASTAEDKSANQEPAKERLASPDQENYASLSREKLIARFKELFNSYPITLIKGHIEAIRSTFEGKTARKQQALKKEFLESGEPEENFAPPIDPLLNTFKELLFEYRKKRDEERTRKEEEKKKNLEAKYEVIENIKDLVNRQESLNATFQEFRELQQKWREIGPVPQKEMHNMWETYHLHVENFYNYIKINKELRDLDLKKNYEKKLALCESAEALLLEPTIVKAFKTLQKYHDQWRETGPVPRENKEELWARFKEATTKINQKHQEHFENIKQQFEKNLQDKRELCEKAEAFLNEEFQNARDWEKASKSIIELQQVWKTIGFAPKKENTEIYHRFRSACDTFFTQKRDFFKRYKEAQIENLELKTELCEQAESIKDSEDWKTTTNEYIRIQKRWKEIGPVPRRSSDAIWKRFREACDHFFNQKANYFSKKDETQDENLKLKEQIIEELKLYQPNKEDNDQNFKNLQAFQSRWSQIGFVPFKDKDRLNSTFRQLINDQFDQLNMDESNKTLQKYRNRIESWKSENASNDRIIQERNKIIGKLKVIENDINIWENNIGFFAKSKSSDALIRDFKNKIESGKRLIKTLNQKLDLLEEMFDRR